MAAMERSSIRYVLRETLDLIISKTITNFNNGVSDDEVIEITTKEKCFTKDSYIWVMKHMSQVELRVRDAAEARGIGRLLAIFRFEECGINAIVEAADILIEKHW